MSQAHPSSLDKGHDLPALLVAIGGAVVFHVAAGFLLWGLVICSGLLQVLVASLFEVPPPPPLEVMEVSMVVMPKTDIAHKAMRAPRPPKSEAPPIEAPPAPVDASSSDLEVRRDKEDAKTPAKTRPAASSTPASSDDLDAQIEAAVRDAALEALVRDAAVGPRDQLESGPQGTDGEPINIGRGGAAGDPELARYVAELERLFKAHFSPNQKVIADNPKIECSVRIKFDLATGEVTDVAVTAPSHVALFDGAAESAARMVGKIPLPPKKYLESFKGSYTVTYDTRP